MSDTLPTDDMSVYLRNSTTAGILAPLNIVYAIPRIGKSEIADQQVTRYFVRGSNFTGPADIVETNLAIYRQAKAHPLYNAISVIWKIGGPLENTPLLTSTGTSIRIVTGVVTANTISIELANEEMDGLVDYIDGNVTRFYIGE